MKSRLLISATAAMLIAAGACDDGKSQAERTARADLLDAAGTSVGTVHFSEGPNGIRLQATIEGVSPGVHGFHIHETGRCADDFVSAGGHFNPTEAAHGFSVDGGPHLGDMPNLHIPEHGPLTVELFVAGPTLQPGASNSLFDEDGSAVVLHAAGDDYRSQPSGAAGARIACGVIETE